MARSVTVLMEDVWTVLGTSPLIVTVKAQGSGTLLINTEQVDATAIVIVPKGSAARQISESSVGATVSAKSGGPGWSVITDAA